MNAAAEVRLDALEHTINGNGKPGLKTDVFVLQRDVSELSDIKTRLARVEKTVWIGLGIIAALQFLLK
jgi:hypothetical protein